MPSSEGEILPSPLESMSSKTCRNCTETSPAAVASGVNGPSEVKLRDLPGFVPLRARQIMERLRARSLRSNGLAFLSRGPTHILKVPNIGDWSEEVGYVVS